MIMKQVSISGAKSVVVVGGSTKPVEKLFCWFGVNGERNFEVGTISAPTVEDAKRILLQNKPKGVIYNIRQIHPDKQFESLGVYTR